MAHLRDRKRKRSDEPFPSDQIVKKAKPPIDQRQQGSSAKRTRSRAVRKASNFTPSFWDNLSKVWLTTRALRELDRRNKAESGARHSTSAELITASLARFASRGGPDLCHLRGYLNPEDASAMSSSRPSTPSSRRTKSTKATSLASKRSSAYTKNFEQDLIDNGIYPEGYEYTDDRSTPEPKNMDDISQALIAPRASLSPSQFSPSTFRDFRRANSRVISEGKVISSILPTIIGRSDIPNEGNLQFTNLDSITKGVTVDAVPDSYDGAYPQAVHTDVRQVLNDKIVPTNHDRAPVAPNFFVEAKAPKGGADVVKRQACLDGAVGARAMHSLQNFGGGEVVYDGKAYTYSSTYHAGTGTLQLYAHHATATPSGPEYHMTQIDTWGMTGNVDSFRRGATAFRNARDLAQRQRTSFIEAANAHASQRETVAHETAEATQLPVGGVDLVNSENNNAWQDADDALQQRVAEFNDLYADDNHTAATSIPQYQCEEDDSQDFSQGSAVLGVDEPSMSFSSSFTSMSTERALSKRPRQSASPQSGSSAKVHSKNQGRRDSSQSHWVETYIRKGKICFVNLIGQEVKTDLREWTEQLVDDSHCFHWTSSKSGRIFWTAQLPEEDEKNRQRH